jgi:hypothetical protein
MYIRHGQTAARQRFFAALEAKFNDDSVNKSSEIEVFFGLKWEKNILKNFVASGSAIYILKIGPQTKKVWTPLIYMIKNSQLISNFHRFHLIRLHSGLCRIQFGNNKYFAGFNFNGVIRNSILGSVHKV